MRSIFLAISVLLFGNSAFAQNTINLLNNYIGVKEALVNSDSKAASQAIDTFYQSIETEENFAQKDELLKAAEKFSKANSLEKQRSVFNDVSTAMWELVKSSDKIDQSVYYQYCPMKKGYWLSREKKIENPYYGSSMLTCGNLSETTN